MGRSAAGKELWDSGTNTFSLLKMAAPGLLGLDVVSLHLIDICGFILIIVLLLLL